MKTLTFAALAATVVITLLPSQALSSIERLQFGLGAFRSLDFGFGARCQALGDCTAAADDFTTVYWNPSLLKSQILGTTYNDRFGAGIHSLFVGGVFKTVILPLGIGTSYQLIPDIQWVDEQGRPGLFSDTEIVILGATAIELPVVPSKFRLGTTAKFYYHDLLSGRALGTGWGFDVGASYKNGPLSAGLVVKDAFDSQIRWSTGATDLRLQQFRLAVAFEQELFLLSGGLTIQEAKVERASLGAELNLGAIAVRGGLNAKLPGSGYPDRSVFGWQLGAGLNLGGFTADFAVVPHQALGPTYVASLALQL